MKLKKFDLEILSDGGRKIKEESSLSVLSEEDKISDEGQAESSSPNLEEKIFSDAPPLLYNSH